MRRRRRHPRSRLLLTLAALLSLVVGYYLGQYWQRRPLHDLSAVVYAAGRPIDYPVALGITDDPPSAPSWRLFVTADTREPACRALLGHYAFVINRLAAAPRVQSRLRLTLLAYDRPDETTAAAFAGGSDWAEVISGTRADLDTLAGQLGILPTGSEWCAALNGNAILVSPRHESWALIPHEAPASMADSIRTIIEFVE